MLVLRYLVLSILASCPSFLEQHGASGGACGTASARNCLVDRSGGGVGQKSTLGRTR